MILLPAASAPSRALPSPPLPFLLPNAAGISTARSPQIILAQLSSVQSSASSPPASSSSPLLRRYAMFALVLAPVPAFAASNMVEDSSLPEFKRMNQDIRIQEVIEGNGATAHEGDLVEFNYVCRRSNGYFVYSTVNQFNGESSPVTLPLDGSTMIAGLQTVIIGMKPGGKRRAVIPPTSGYVTPNLEPQPREFGPKRSLLSHVKEPLLFEVQLLKIK